MSCREGQGYYGLNITSGLFRLSFYHLPALTLSCRLLTHLLVKLGFHPIPADGNSPAVEIIFVEFIEFFLDDLDEILLLNG